MNFLFHHVFHEYAYRGAEFYRHSQTIERSLNSGQRAYQIVHVGIAHMTDSEHLAGISAQADISLYPGSDKAHAIISPNFNSQTIRLEGRIVPYGQSRVYEGMSL